VTPKTAGSGTQVALAPPEAPPGKAPTQAKPPAAEVPKTPAKTPVAAAAMPKSGTGTFFLQLAAYQSEKGAQDLAARLAPTYPTQVVAPQGSGTPVYRVLVGPLNKAESGTLLTWFRYRGFPDAFLKQQ
jgi:cell division septation protein DedD